MILIVGGKHQGKEAFAKATFPEKEIITNLHITIHERLNRGEDLTNLVDELIQKYKDAVITCDEVGNGVVPIEKEERNYRDVTGRTLIELAKNSEEVYRVICGLGQKLKG